MTLNIKMAVPLETRNGGWVTIVQRPADGCWGFAWRTPIMPVDSFWYFDSYREMLNARRRFIQDNGGRI